MNSGEIMKPREESWYCGAQRKHGAGPCRKRAGERTAHLGQGRCYLHLGRAHDAQITSGRYSVLKLNSPTIQKLREQYLENPDPFNLLSELATQRALLHDYLDRYDAFEKALMAWHESWSTGDDSKPRPAKLMDISDAWRLVDSVTRIVERIIKMRNVGAISRSEFARVLDHLLKAVALEVGDEVAQARIKRVWGETRIG